MNGVPKNAIFRFCCLLFWEVCGIFGVFGSDSDEVSVLGICVFVK